jgi:hypothetical protein
MIPGVCTATPSERTPSEVESPCFQLASLRARAIAAARLRQGAPLALLLALGLVRCAHAPLPAPPSRRSPVEARTEYYQRFRPRVHYRGLVRGSDIGTIALELANGELVSHPSQLLPAVRRRSPTANFTREVVQIETTSNHVMIAGGSSIAAGGLVFLLGFLLNQRHVSIPASIAGGVLGAGGIVTFGVSAYIRASSRLPRSLAFESFDGDLQERLAIDPSPGSD